MQTDITKNYIAIGSGFFVAPQRIVTCAHVVNFGAQLAEKHGNRGFQLSVEWGDKQYLANILQVTDETYPDIALLESKILGHPCVFANPERERRDPLVFFGFPSVRDESKMKYTDRGEEYLATLGGRANSGETFSIDNTPVLHGTSGSAILNERTGAVCGIVMQSKSPRPEFGAGGRAIPIEEVWQRFEGLHKENREFHQINLVWVNYKEKSQYTRFLLPAPFEWITIPQGLVTLKLIKRRRQIQKQITVPSFQISKYPITNAQYQVFLDDPNGYSNNRWWESSSDLRTWKAQHPNSILPEFEESELPRTNISWYECLAFCQWLSHKTGDNVSLPKEAQWQRSAQGNSNSAYPWGESWIKNLCNHYDPPHADQLTPVDNYPDGASIYGVFDLSGNAWEWCSDRFENGKLERVLRGGSFRERMVKHFRTDFRRGFDPSQRGASAGFRIVKVG
ncbi:MAG: SUMF1/EgtB/PvdO family nonheme iron enzyme [Ardenticatenaceae bacterium]|nr:SUMF1/EgtB/PvdO family nonheme iron enzyme [Ardenticatenaceae bacterium]